MATVFLHRSLVTFLLVCLPTALCAPKEGQQNAKFPGDCNFDSNNICSWHQSENDQFDWTLRKGRTPSSGTGPNNDFSGSGYYVYIETSSPKRQGEKALLMGGPFSDTYCLRFAYNMNGGSIGELNIIHHLSQDIKIWHNAGSQGQDWKTANATVYGNNYYVIFEGIVGSSYTGDIAIDNIHFVKGTCNGEPVPEEKGTANQDYCDFDLGLCDWANDFKGAAQGAGKSTAWRLSSYRDPSTKQDPDRPTDHGTKFGGKYVYAERKLRGQTKTKSRLVSHRVCGSKCVELFYFTRKFMNTESELRLSARIDGKEDRLWFTNGAGTQEWTRAVVDVKAENKTCFEVVFESLLGGARNPIVGLDDILIANGSCCPMMNTPEEAAEENCDFDKGIFCNWKHSVKSTFFWSIGSGPTKSGQESRGLTGPTKDASGKGLYAYIESSEPQILGDKAILISDVIAGQQCMQFKYHMHGEDTGSLSIYRRGILLWKESGNHGDQWLQGQVDLDCSIPEYHIEIEATVVGWRGDIAIDELQFTPGQCPKTNTTAVIVQPIMPPILPPPYSTCTFSQNLCSWSNALNDDGDWKIHSGDTSSFQTGPAHDNDGDNYYIYMEASDMFEGKEVRLESKEFRIPICLSFGYYMFGKDVKELRLEQTNLKDNTTEVVWSKTGEQGDNWIYGSQNISGEHYTVSFVAVRGKSYLSDIALDTISVNDIDRCKFVGDVAYGNPKEGNCDFENGTTPLCKWCDAKRRKMDKFDWTRNKGSTPSSKTGPTGDHTTAKGEGYYIFIEASSPRRGGETAVLLLKLEGRAICMRFWYHMKGDNRMIGSLRIMHHVTKKTENDHSTLDGKTNRNQCKELEEEWPKETGKQMWSKAKNQGDKWLEVEVSLDVKRSVGAFGIHWIEIIGEIGGGWSGDIAVDDIDFQDGRCSKRRTNY